MNTDLQLVYATWALVVATLIGAILILVGLFLSAKADREQTKILRQRETIRLYLETTDHRRFGEAHDRALLARMDVSERIELAKTESVEGKTARRLIRDYLNYWESIAAGVLADVLDEAVLKQIARGRVIQIVRDYREFIVWRRQEGDRPNLWSDLETLAERWSKKTIA